MEKRKRFIAILDPPYDDLMEKIRAVQKMDSLRGHLTGSSPVDRALSDLPYEVLKIRILGEAVINGYFHIEKNL